MDRDVLCYYILNGCPESHWDEVIAGYCLAKGKNVESVKLLLQALSIYDPFKDMRQQMVHYILETLAIEYKIVGVYDKNNQLIFVY